MNRGVLQNSPVQQMMAAGNTNWWAITATRPPSHHHHPNSPLTPPLPTHHHHNNNNFNFVSPHLSPFPFSSPFSWPLNAINRNDHIAPDSWSHQLLMNGLVGEEEKSAGLMINQAAMEQLVKQENYNPSASHAFVYQNNEDFQEAAISNTNNNNNNNSLWSPHHNSKFMVSSASTNSTTTTTTTTSSPQSCVTNNLFEISSTTAKSDHQVKSEVRKFGDRITTLHQQVSPFGKIDTASVLLEAIGYIRFLQSQIEVKEKRTAYFLKTLASS